MRFHVYYMKPDFWHTGIHGAVFLQKQGKLPSLEKLRDTHVFVKTIDVGQLSDVYREMQGEFWSPNGEARDTIEKAGLQHTSMCVGDIAIDQAGNAYMVDNVGWFPLSGTKAA